MFLVSIDAPHNPYETVQEDLYRFFFNHLAFSNNNNNNFILIITIILIITVLSVYIFWFLHSYFGGK